MQRTDAEEIIECLPKDRTIFRYFKDRYALELLSYFVGDGKLISEVKKSPFGKLLSKPLLKALSSRLGGALLTRQALQAAWPAQPEAYLLTLGLWGSSAGHRGFRDWYYQTSRRGVNLVLQLNFSGKHDRPYEKLIKPQEDRHPFEYSEHPINKDGRRTLAWSRLDIELKSGEALIEEIQTDWIRLAAQMKTAVEEVEVDEEGHQRVVQRVFGGDAVETGALDKYVKRVLRPHMHLWDEAILCATIWFLVRELGVRCIFYHTFDSCVRMKSIGGSLPPRSVYTTLPRRFCFQETEMHPSFLGGEISRERKRAKRKKRQFVNPRFFVLEL